MYQYLITRHIKLHIQGYVLLFYLFSYCGETNFVPCIYIFLPSGYGEWRTCSTKLSRLTRVVTYRAVLGNKWNVDNNYEGVCASILSYFAHLMPGKPHFIDSLYLPLFTFVYLFTCQVIKSIEAYYWNVIAKVNKQTSEHTGLVHGKYYKSTECYR